MLACKCPREDGNQRVGGDISSHAQKHFIKECIAGKLLPAKVGGPSLVALLTNAASHRLARPALQALGRSGTYKMCSASWSSAPEECTVRQSEGADPYTQIDVNPRLRFSRAEPSARHHGLLGTSHDDCYCRCRSRAQGTHWAEGCSTPSAGLLWPTA